MDKTVVLMGLGQLGRVFAGGLLRTGHIVVPVTREDSMAAVAARYPDPDLVMVSVAENDLHPVLSGMPEAWKDSVGLLQNELLPRDWLAHGIESPTVVSVWFEKKKGTDAKPLISSPVYGPEAQRLVRALESIDLPAHTLPDGDSLAWELVRKNLYILTTNIAGLETGGTVGALWDQHRELAERVANEVLDVQDWLMGHAYARPPLLGGMLEAFEADPEHGCAGRSAPARLRRALHHADVAGLQVPTMREIASRHGVN